MRSACAPAHSSRPAAALCPPGVTTSVSAAKRYRLRCLKAVILALAAPDAPEVTVAVGGEGEEGGEGLAPEERAKQVRACGRRHVLVIVCAALCGASCFIAQLGARSGRAEKRQGP